MAESFTEKTIGSVSSIIAVGYEARKFGVKRGMSGDEAQKLCPDMTFARVVERRGKADLTKYRKASTEVMQALSHFSDCLERASIDEAFIDVTSMVEQRMKKIPFSALKPEMLNRTHIVGWDQSERSCVDSAEDTEEQDDGVVIEGTYEAYGDGDVNELESVGDINELASVAMQMETVESRVEETVDETRIGSSTRQPSLESTNPVISKWHLLIYRTVDSEICHTLQLQTRMHA